MTYSSASTQHWFNNDGSDLSCDGVKKGFDAFEVVVRRNHKLLSSVVTQANLAHIRSTEDTGHVLWFVLAEATQQRAMVGSFKNYDLFALGVLECRADGIEVGLGSRVTESHELHGREPAHKTSCKAGLGSGMATKLDTRGERFADGCLQGWVAFAIDAAGEVGQAATRQPRCR